MVANHDGTLASAKEAAKVPTPPLEQRFGTVDPNGETIVSDRQRNTVQITCTVTPQLYAKMKAVQDKCLQVKGVHVSTADLVRRSLEEFLQSLRLD